ncbi:Uncharacterised protein [Legionella oakridgensis]|nr:Uncharacterised protein [Legionella oakridgensis]
MTSAIWKDEISFGLISILVFTNAEEKNDLK